MQNYGSEARQLGILRIHAATEHGEDSEQYQLRYRQPLCSLLSNLKLSTSFRRFDTLKH